MEQNIQTQKIRHGQRDSSHGSVFEYRLTNILERVESCAPMYNCYIFKWGNW